jgi:hypothetical protein
MRSLPNLQPLFRAQKNNEIGVCTTNSLKTVEHVKNLKITFDLGSLQKNIRKIIEFRTYLHNQS